MIFLNKIHLCLFIIIFACIANANGSSSGSRGGGDIESAEFYSYIINCANYLKIEKEYAELASRFEDILANVKISSINEQLYLDGVAVDAINDHDKVSILFDSNKWNSLSRIKKYQLAIHEMLGLLQIQDNGYFKSQQLSLFVEQIETTAITQYASPIITTTQIKLSEKEGPGYSLYFTKSSTIQLEPTWSMETYCEFNYHKPFVEKQTIFRPVKVDIMNTVPYGSYFVVYLQENSLLEYDRISAYYKCTSSDNETYNRFTISDFLIFFKNYFKFVSL